MDDQYTNDTQNRPESENTPEEKSAGYGDVRESGYGAARPGYGAQTPYGSRPPYGERPYNGAGYNYGAPYAPGQGYNAPQPPAPKKNRKIGRSIFAVLLCLCLIVGAFAIGKAISDRSGNGSVTVEEKEDKGKTNKDDADNDRDDKGNGPAANAQDSPVSFSEYTGKGTMTPEQIYDKVKDINVGIIVYASNQKAGEGSGIIVGEDASGTYTYVLTAAHMLSDKGTSFAVQFTDGKEVEAELVGYDTKTDVGVVKVKATGYTAAEFGNSDKLVVGQKVYAIGNPGGAEFFGSFTSGIIGAIDRPVGRSNSSYDLECIQHNAAINPGNSGGALVNEYGQVIGLNSSKIAAEDYEGMGFAVPSNTVLEVYEELIEHGYVTNRPAIGITYFAVANDYTYASIAWRNSLPYGSIVIQGISTNSSLNDTDVRKGDLIVAADGEKLETTDVLLEKIENSKIGDTLKLTIVRLNNNGSIARTFDVTIKLVESQGENAFEEEEEETEPQNVNPFENPFSDYFGGFGN